MEKILEIDINKESDLFETYNNKKVSRELIQYMVDSYPKMNRDDTLKIVINNNIKKVRCAELIKMELDEACRRSDFRFHNTNLKQLSFLIIGVFALVIASFIDWDVIKEVVIIGAWVLLWDAVELEIVDDISNRKKKKIYKKLLKSEFVENIK